MGKVPPILVTLTSRSDSDFERSNVSLKECMMTLIRTLTISIATFQRMNEKFYGFRQTEYSLTKKSQIFAVLETEL